ncbi:NAD(P)H-dependent oxidoreductase [Gephyromycinifex aptenodytis]|uniref:NAD(P)H-dependent oxidoreductase n=1 Tax=Gephyromycinifex aptenodytis TaxID=2716227 RepID=UPI001447D550|nr:NAD(P)H-dependent oxidoreductase [Gephyromycinifex aptenodytis]
MAQLLIVHHSPTPSMRALTESVIAGARDESITGVQVRPVPALETTAADVLAADALVLGTPANFGYMSGALKHFFDSTFMHIGGAPDAERSTETNAGGALPFGMYVHGRHDTTGAVRSVTSIVGALPWIQSAPALEIIGDVSAEHHERAYELGATLAALISQ